jgi:hypothetical protein
MAMAMSQRSSPLLLLQQTKPVSFSPSLCSLPPLAVAPQLCRWSRRKKRRMRAFLFMQKDPSPQKPGSFFSSLNLFAKPRISCLSE